MIAPALRVLGAAATAGFLAIGFTPLPDLLTRGLSRTDPLRPADAIVVLAAGGVRPDGELTDQSLRRTIHGFELYHQTLAPVLLLSGPVSSSGHVEADVRRAMAQTCGIAAEAILTVSRGRTTREEAGAIGDVLRRRGIRRILLVADAEGMRRSAALFARSGFDVIASPTMDGVHYGGVPGERFAQARRVAIELLAWLYYRLGGYI